MTLPGQTFVSAVRAEGPTGPTGPTLVPMVLFVGLPHIVCDDGNRTSWPHEKLIGPPRALPCTVESIPAGNTIAFGPPIRLS